MESFAFIPSNLHKESHILATNWSPLLDVMLIKRSSFDHMYCMNSSTMALANVLSFSSKHGM